MRTLSRSVLLAALVPKFGAQTPVWSSGVAQHDPLVRGLAVGAAEQAYVLVRDASATPGARVLAFRPNGALQWSALHAQAPGTTLQPRVLERAPNGNLLVGATLLAPPFSAAPHAFELVAFDAHGVEQWSHSVPGALRATAFDATELAALAVDGASRVFAAGALEWLASASDVTTVALDADGTRAWTAHFDGGALRDDYARAVVADGSGGAITAGSARFASDEGMRIVTLGYDAHGALAWSCAYPSSPVALGDAHEPVAIARTPLGELYVAGTHTTSAGDAVIELVKLASSGALVWSRSFAGTGAARHVATALHVDAHGRATIAGFAGPRLGASDPLVVQYDENGALLWFDCQGCADDGVSGRANDVVADAVGRVYVAAETADQLVPGARATTLAYGAQGGWQWSASSAPSAVAAATEIELASGGPLVGSHAIDASAAAALLLTRYVDVGFANWGTGVDGSDAFAVELFGQGAPVSGGSFDLGVIHGQGGASAWLALGFGVASHVELPFAGGALYVLPQVVLGVQLGGTRGVSGVGSAQLPFAIPADAALVGANVRFQIGVLDAGALEGVALSSALDAWIG